MKPYGVFIPFPSHTSQLRTPSPSQYGHLAPSSTHSRNYTNIFITHTSVALLNIKHTTFYRKDNFRFSFIYITCSSTFSSPVPSHSRKKKKTEGRHSKKMIHKCLAIQQTNKFKCVLICSTSLWSDKVFLPNQNHK